MLHDLSILAGHMRVPIALYLLPSWVKLVLDVGAQTTMIIGNLFESSDYVGRSFCWLAVVSVP